MLVELPYLRNRGWFPTYVVTLLVGVLVGYIGNRGSRVDYPTLGSLPCLRMITLPWGVTLASEDAGSVIKMAPNIARRDVWPDPPSC